MRPLLLSIVVAWICVLAGCSNGDQRPGGLPGLDGSQPFDASDDLARQTFDIVPIDIVVRDVPPAEVPIEVGMNCSSDGDCAFGARCLGGLCALDSCRTTDNPCGAEARCLLRCVPTRDLCAGVICGNQQTCFLGRCVAGCFPAPCSGINCPSGQFCDDSLGACVPVRPCAAACGTDYACHVQCLPRSNCDGVSCPSNQVCSDGRCVANPCAGVTCGAGSLCVAGVCVDTCRCDPACTRSPRDRCVVGQCVCTRTCVAGGPCGADDGCGGRCVGACENPFATCDPVAATCTCAPRCTADAPCGSSDGCGGQCEGGCAAGERCDTATRSCVCTTYCPPVERFGDYPCGMTVPNLCVGQPSCGTGTGCPMGMVCGAEMRCEPEEMRDGGMSDAEEGCPPGRSRCEGGCFNLQTDNTHCGDCDTRCPVGTTCRAGVCTCPTSLTLCGSRCVNTQGDQGNCGACENPCSELTTCTNGSCSCVPHCPTDPGLVACGADVPNACINGPSCGRGRRCPQGSICDEAAGRCVCIPRCPPGVRCGVSDGCGGTCIGGCDTGETCARDPMDETRYFCSSAGCVGGCACNEVCSMNRCVTITCANGSSPCPCACCPAGQMCVGGSACVPIPP